MTSWPVQCIRQLYSTSSSFNDGFTCFSTLLCSVTCLHCILTNKLKLRPMKFAPGGRGICQNFDRDARPIFLGLKSGQILFFWVGKFFSYFSGFRKMSAIFGGLTNLQLFFGSSNFCMTHLNPLNEEHTVLTSIIS